LRSGGLICEVWPTGPDRERCLLLLQLQAGAACDDGGGCVRGIIFGVGMMGATSGHGRAPLLG
jgi:hypothetical protein